MRMLVKYERGRWSDRASPSSFVNNGTFFMHAAPPWQDLDMRHLPGLFSDNSTRNTTAQTVLTELDARLERIKHALATGRYPDTSGDGDGDTALNCTFSIYGHLRSLPSHVTQDQMREYERELHNPSGVSPVTLPAPQMDAILFSKGCNLVLSLNEMDGLEWDKFWDKAIVYAFVLACVTLVQTWVLVKQMEYTSTPTVRAVLLPKWYVDGLLMNTLT